ncbi:hypothetical protein ACFX13_009086 [Malus domestica]
METLTRKTSGQMRMFDAMVDTTYYSIEDFNYYSLGSLWLLSSPRNEHRLQPSNRLAASLASSQAASQRASPPAEQSRNWDPKTHRPARREISPVEQRAVPITPRVSFPEAGLQTKASKVGKSWLSKGAVPRTPTESFPDSNMQLISPQIPREKHVPSFGIVAYISPCSSRSVFSE